MDVKTLLLQQWTSCLDQEDWFPPLEKVLEDITLEQATWKPTKGTTNSIWEIVCHLLFYKKRLLVRYLDETENELQAENNDATFRLPTLTLQNWKETKEEYLYVHRELEKILAKSAQEDLDREVRGERTLVLELKSIAMHDAYHIGQIVFLSKMQDVWPGQHDC
ncbi:DinB family protein [Lysinibacillus fusiformis]|uniref:DinB superfamily protein n=1 Tax=Lysinibacillus fusiformis TaxID=28031 RepID=A0A1H9S7X4_9BACI|nr:DinB family protein [Lysinibacillus fusiformis]SCY82987.1 DinB superfamily protein [Lysinibacillus fusiformis]SEO54995.1 DinB superfamily protein [Lysinibacillus fusiformis]SER81146.1 DinB superfamily protein [Lysinibacillus fusiformis]